MYADQFAGADMGAKINAAYAALPSSGGTIIVPSGAYSFSTEIALSTNKKPVYLQCAAGGGTILTWTGGANSTSTLFDTGDVAGTTGTFNALNGISGCDFEGPNTGGTENGTVGLQIGKTNGAPSSTFTGLHILGFDEGIVTGNNTWNILISSTALEYNNQAYIDEGTTNEGENNCFDFDLFSECNTTAKCVYLPTSSTASMTFNQDAFDDAQLFVADGNFATNVMGGHFENPNVQAVGQYIPIIYAQANNGYSQFNINGTAFVDDATTSGKAWYNEILSGGPLNVQSVSVDGNGGIASPAFVQEVNTGFQTMTLNDVYSINNSGYSIVSTSSSLFIADPRANFFGIATSTNYNSSVLNVQGTTNLDGSIELDNPAAIGSFATLSFNGSALNSTWPWVIATSVTTPVVAGGSNTNSTLTLEGTSNGSPASAYVLINPTAGSGNVGIASSTPWAQLSVGSGAIVVAEASSTGSGYNTVNFQSQQTSKIEMNANTTINLQDNAPTGEQEKVILCQDLTGSRTVTWLSSTTLIWAADTAPTQTATAKHCDVYSFIVTGATGTAEVFGAQTANF